jgi:catechol 2,3-dioxygenase-like lactoylglutathione lyase family enzyme
MNRNRLFSMINKFWLTLILASTAVAQQPLPTPGFHHIHLNATDPEGAIAFYARQFPSATSVTFAGLPALKAGSVYVLFNKVKVPPPTTPPTALWHFGWQVTDIHQKLALFKQRPDVHLPPLYIADENGKVFKAEIAEAKTGGGFAFLAGPDGAIIEYQGNMAVERINHVHLFQQDPFCAELWYRDHLNAPSKSQYTEANCKVPRPVAPSWPAFEPGGMLRQPAGVTFDDVAVTWHVQQNDTPLAPSRGHLLDHFALSVADLDAWIAKLRREKVKFLTRPYKLGTLRAVMIEGPSREAIELVEVR